MVFKKQNHGYFSQLQTPKTALELSVKLNEKNAFQLRTVKIDQKPISWPTWQKTGVLWMWYLYRIRISIFSLLHRFLKTINITNLFF